MLVGLVRQVGADVFVEVELQVADLPDHQVGGDLSPVDDAQAHGVQEDDRLDGQRPVELDEHVGMFLLDCIRLHFRLQLKVGKLFFKQASSFRDLESQTAN